MASYKSDWFQLAINITFIVIDNNNILKLRMIHENYSYQKKLIFVKGNYYKNLKF